MKNDPKKKTMNPRLFRKTLITSRASQSKKNHRVVTIELAWEYIGITKERFRFFGKIAAYTAASIACLCFITAANMYLMRVFPVPKPTVRIVSHREKKPAEIIIPAVKIDLPIIPAAYTRTTLETTTQGASYLTTSPLPGQIGNSIIYAHNWQNLFGNLPHVKIGERVTIAFTDRSQQTFIVTKTQTVPATDISILQPTSDNRITLFTCQNFLDADRFVVTAVASSK